MNERVRSGLTDEVVAAQIAQAQPKLAEFIERATPFIETDPTTKEAHELAQEWFALITEVFGEQIEMVTVLRQRWMLDEAPALPCTKEFAEWMIIAMTCGSMRHSWMAKAFSKEIIVQFADMATKTPFGQTLGRQQAQAALLQEIA